MLAASQPPIASSPITPFLDEHAFKSTSVGPISNRQAVSRKRQAAFADPGLENAISLDGSRARRILGFKARMLHVEVSELRRIVDEFQDDGIWSVSDPRYPLSGGLQSR